jgi:hypothetical protein
VLPSDIFSPRPRPNSATTERPSVKDRTVCIHVMQYISRRRVVQLTEWQACHLLWRFIAKWRNWIRQFTSNPALLNPCHETALCWVHNTVYAVLCYISKFAVCYVERKNWSYISDKSLTSFVRVSNSLPPGSEFYKIFLFTPCRTFCYGTVGPEAVVSNLMGHILILWHMGRFYNNRGVSVNILTATNTGNNGRTAVSMRWPVSTPY